MSIIGGLDLRHEALVFRMGVRGPRLPAVVAVG
jgi:hypothetical protein